MLLKIVWNSDNDNFGVELKEALKDSVDIELYDMSTKNKKKGYRVMNVCGATKIPFVSVYDNELKKAFYTEDSSCSISNILNYLEL